MGQVAAPTESRAVIHNVRWRTYEALLRDRGDSGPRLFYDEGTLEILSPSRKHERWKKLLGRLLEAFTEELDIEISSGGSTTLKDQFKSRGAEPDESYYVKHQALVRGKDEVDLTQDPPPDLIIEVDVTSQSIDKLAVYAALKVPEVWSYGDAGLIIRRLHASGRYAVSRRSAALPRFPTGEIKRFLEARKSLGETRLVKEFRAWVRARRGGR